MRPSTFFKFALVAFAAAPTAFAYGADYDYVEARDIDAADNMISARALEEYYDNAAVTARDLGEAIDLMIVERQLAGEDTQELEARLLSFSTFLPYISQHTDAHIRLIVPKLIGTGVKMASGIISHRKKH